MRLSLTNLKPFAQNVTQRILDYFLALQNTWTPQASEHTFRTPLENLLKIVTQKRQPSLAIQHEAKTQYNSNVKPDFVVYENGLPIACLETKKIGESLENHLDSLQIQNYKKLYDHIILTNYTDFILIR
jgi:type I site-specific restriction-modification system R (restriction) subunit